MVVIGWSLRPPIRRTRCLLGALVALPLHGDVDTRVTLSWGCFQPATEPGGGTGRCVLDLGLLQQAACAQGIPASLAKMSSEPHWPVFPPSPSFLLSPHRCRTCFVVRSLPLSAPTPSSLYPSQMFPLRNLSNVSYCLSICSSSVPTTHLILRPVDQRGSLNWPGEELSMAPGNRLSQGEVAGSNYK